MRNSVRHLPSLLVLVIAACIGSYPLFADPRLYSAHDIWHQVARLYHYSQAIFAGDFFPTWIANLANGFGYPLFIFSYHAPWLLGTVFMLFGVSLFTTIKLLFFCSYLAAGISMYAFILGVTRQRLPATIAGLAYLYAPYHFLTLFVSAAIGTAFMFACIPCLFYGVFLIFNNKKKAGAALVSIASAVAILSHLMTFIYVLGAVVAYIGFLTVIHFRSVQVSVTVTKKAMQKKTAALAFLRALPIELFWALGAVALGFALSAFYLLPLFNSYSLIIAEEQAAGFADLYKSNFITFKQLLYSRWGFGPIVSNAKDGEISLQVGIGQWLAVGMAAGLIFLRMVKFKYVLLRKLNLHSQDWFFLALFGMSIFAMTDYSLVLWEFATQFISLDYPFRLLILAVFAGSALLGLAVAQLAEPKMQWLASAAFLIVLVYTNRNHSRVNMYTDYPLDLYVRAETTTNTFHEYLPKTAAGELLQVVDPRAVVEEAVTITRQMASVNKLELALSLDQKSAVTFRQFDYPGQTVWHNGAIVSHQRDDSGRIKIELSEGEHELVVSFVAPALFATGKIISLFSLGAVLYLLVTQRKHAYEKK